jgi:hypothetical protein
VANPTRSHVARCLVAAISLAASGALAAGSDDASALFVRGRKLVEQGEYQAALADLRTSYAQMSSPNTLLLIAHAERGIRHRVEAAVLYEQVVREAEQKVKAGEARYQAALDDARKRLDELSAELARVELRVKHAPADATVTIAVSKAQGRRDADGTLVLDRVWTEPGKVPVHVESGKGAVDVAVSLSAGVMDIVSLDYETQHVVRPSDPGPVVQVAPTPTPAPVKEERASGSGRVPIMTWISGGIGLAGLATFAVAGTMSNNHWSDLESCSPHCGDSERSKADAGRREQTIANVGLVVGGVGIAAAAGFLLLGGKKDGKAKSSVGWELGPGRAAMRVQW